MNNLLSCITPVYRKYVSVLEKNGNSLDLNLKDPGIEVSSPKTISSILTTYLDYIKKCGWNAKIIISSTDKEVIIKDSNTMIPDTLKEEILVFDGVKVSSRLGFGTKIKVKIDY